MRGYPGRIDNYGAIVSVGLVATVALIYILWNPGTPNKRSGKRKKVAGLENLGNTCYLNTILQSLAACPAFLAWLNRTLRRGCFKGKGSELAYRLSHTIEGVNDHTSPRIFSPHEVLYALYSRNWRAGQEQQDAHELFQFLLSELSEDREQIPSPVSLSEAPKLAKHASNGVIPQSGLRSSIKANLPRVTSRDVDSPFRGLLANHLTCTQCGHRNPVTYTSFDCLSLPIPSLGLFTTLSLDCILLKFTLPELVYDVECVECTKRTGTQGTAHTQGGATRQPESADGSSPGVGDGRNVIVPTEGMTRGQGDGETVANSPTKRDNQATRCKRVFQKQMTIGKLPQCLCIHIQRVGWQPDGQPFRREEHIMFPETLDMSRYRLASVIATCNNGLPPAKRLLRPAAQDKPPVANGHATLEKKPPPPSNHTFIGDSFLSPTRPASLRLVGGGWMPRSGEGQGEEETEAETPGLEEELGAGFQDAALQNAKPMESKYKLVSAVVHMGNAYSGHFLTYRRGPSQPGEQLNKNWLCVSDESVYTAVLSDVLSQKAYMLYYQRE
ncbi:ubiquitin carboxyl-terminal hydrolase 30-like [Diadema setosum]|uniref:ubiquitin carboxyl-terminal hydrolase 30-like n=1 Tax=Diadema setosum TaxID=31175 RepID=UPI003B3B6479